MPIMSVNGQTKRRLLNVVLFVFLSIPGLGLFLFSCDNLWVGIIVPQVNHLSLITSGLCAILGLVLMLIGVGKYRNWKYYLIFLFIPIVFFGYISLDKHARGGKLMPIAMALIIVVLALYLIRFMEIKWVQGNSAMKKVGKNGVESGK